ncbi:MAG: BTAD domain-containing putative transcriptional regulator [Tissierellia bacterium]|jgi:DNA-binding SARP family transcriptional activator|nr:BTAD domain-containing putative transcriptional regulator [Tissierellia bacterium]MDD3227001.1 BTAD domain-containing putative transcriptional regulator [Tissierellia bacterium]MDD3751025.1 BTAD domain-containing putative transcriptional regulator [Tissierellia bacterium]MDD4045649.1 BTAD domain-containing putative transcriptional regulator [Tissierellia bacterium]MDD4679038.1 BTAD domain-containing putative transcriptional regulator [Tissierellia bacterium]
MLNLSFLGKSKIEYDGKEIEDKLGNKAIALVCLLVLNERRYLSREKIIGYLWPDSNTDAAKYNLRYNLWLIKKNILEDKKNNSFIKVDTECCSINSKYEFNCDIINIMKFKPSCQDSVEGILKLKRLFRGDLLEGCYFNKCDEFNNLIIYERINFEQHKVKILQRLVEVYENDNRYEDCIDVLNEILEIEPYDEKIALKLMDIYQKSGKRAVAINYYNEFSYNLSCSLGIHPSNELRNKYNEIKMSVADCDETKSGEDYIVKTTDNSDINIISYCIKNVEYFWMSDVIGKIVNIGLDDYIKQLNQKQLMDLAYIQSEILRFCNEDISSVDYKTEVIGVRIINSFVKLLEAVCNERSMIITILNKSDMDGISSNVVDYLKRIQIEGLRIIEE